jgi:hypothetical protein
MLTSGRTRGLYLLGAAMTIGPGGGCAARFHNDPFAARPTAHVPVASRDNITLAARIPLPEPGAGPANTGATPADRRELPATTLAGVPEPASP